MFCPKCGARHDDQSLYCGSCGSALPTAPVVFGEPKKGSHWPPVLIMAAMAVVGLVCFFLFPLGGSDPSPTMPVKDSWCEFYNGALTHFYPDLYNGGKSLTIPETINGQPVLRIGKTSFYDCDTLSEVILPQGLVEIGDSAFENCGALRGIYIPETTARIGSRAFAHCGSLEAVCISDTIESIEADAFTGCDSLHYIIFSGTITQWEAVFRGEVGIFTYVYCSDGVVQQGPAHP